MVGAAAGPLGFWLWWVSPAGSAPVPSAGASTGLSPSGVGWVSSVLEATEAVPAAPSPLLLQWRLGSSSSTIDMATGESLGPRLPSAGSPTGGGWVRFSTLEKENGVAGGAASEACTLKGSCGPSSGEGATNPPAGAAGAWVRNLGELLLRGISPRLQKNKNHY